MGGQVYIVNELNTMNEDQQFPTGLLIKNTITAFKGGFLSEEQALFVLDFTAKLGDIQAQELFDRSKEASVTEVFNKTDR